jgi:inversin
MYHAISPFSSFLSYTSLDYALMEEHIDVAQFMIEQGGLSITGIQDIAALKIQVSAVLLCEVSCFTVKLQAVFRGYRVRKTFLDRKKLLMKHEQLRKDAAK